MEVPERDDAETARVRAVLEDTVASWGHDLPVEWHAS